jgi:hypothetical protein
VSLPTFESCGWFHVGKRQCVGVILDRDCHREELLKLFGRVIVDGVEYEVEGIDSYAVPCQRKGWAIGLMIKGERKSLEEPAARPVHVECGECGHWWVGFYLPQPIRIAARLMGALICPKCAAAADFIRLVDERKRQRALSPSMATAETTLSISAVYPPAGGERGP